MLDLHPDHIQSARYDRCWILVLDIDAGCTIQMLDLYPISTYSTCIHLYETPASGICIQVDSHYGRCWIKVLYIDAGCIIQMLDLNPISLSSTCIQHLYETPASGTCIQHLHPIVVKVKVHCSKCIFYPKNYQQRHKISPNSEF